MIYILIYIWTLTTRCLKVRVIVGIQTIVYIFKSTLFHWNENNYPNKNEMTKHNFRNGTHQKPQRWQHWKVKYNNFIKQKCSNYYTCLLYYSFCIVQKSLFFFLKTDVFVVKWHKWHNKLSYLFSGALYNQWKLIKCSCNCCSKLSCGGILNYEFTTVKSSMYRNDPATNPLAYCPTEIFATVKYL